MARFQPITVEIDHVRYTGAYEAQGKDAIRVTSDHGGGDVVVQLGRYDAEAAARNALEDLVKAWLKRRHG